MKASLVAYDCGELHKKSYLIIVKYGYDRGCPKKPATQIGSLKILGVIEFEVEKKTSFAPCKTRLANFDSSWLKNFALNKVVTLDIMLRNCVENPLKI
jgi:hypothetical protein